MDLENRIRPAFTLVELLVVLAIIGILVGILLPAVQMVREGARRTDCLNRVRQLGLGLLNHESAHGSFPSGITAGDASPRQSYTWQQAVLPFIEQQPVYDQAQTDYATSPSPFYSHLGMRTVVSTFQCPSDTDAGEPHYTHEFRLVASTNYLGVNGTNWSTEDGIFFRDSRTTTADIGDGLSNTLMIGERPPSPDFWYGWWYAGFGQEGTGSADMLLGMREIKAVPSDGRTTYLESCPDGPYQFVAGKRGQQCDTLHFWSYHPGGSVFAMADGSVRMIGYDANEIMPALATRAGSETVNVPE